MSIGLFLDVDRTLTEDTIQRQFAHMLGVSVEYEEIERAFQEQQITSDEFAERLIEIFTAARFTEQFAVDNYSKIEQRPWTRELVHLQVNLHVTVYLVSSGPSYYVKRLGAQHKISEANVLCSEYEFDSHGKMTRCRSVSKLDKAGFVQEKRKTHRITIGIGDNETHDGPFISNCDIPILTSSSRSDFLHCSGLNVVKTIVQNLSHVSFPRKNQPPKVLILSSSEAIEIANAVQGKIEQNGTCEATVWTDKVFKPSRVIIESLEDALNEFDFAVFVMQPDDALVSREQTACVVRDNVLFELGLFFGRIGRSRCFCLCPKETRLKLPSDLLGVVYLEYDQKRAATNAQASVNVSAAAIRERISQEGSREILH